MLSTFECIILRRQRALKFPMESSQFQSLKLMMYFILKLGSHTIHVSVVYYYMYNEVLDEKQVARNVNVRRLTVLQLDC